MEIKITTLSENTAKFGFLAEWGLSLLVEVDGARILLDAGMGFSTVYNAGILGVDLTSVDRIVLSHGHGDHTGGLRDVLRRRGEVEVIGHPDIWAPKYALPPDEKRERYVGIPFARKELENLGARFSLGRGPVRITDRVMTTGEIPMVTAYEEIDKNLYVKNGDKLQPDPLADDLALVIDTEFGLVVILGCAHRGLINTLCHAQKLTGKEHTYAVIGGSHLFRASQEGVDRAIAELKTVGVKKLGVSHCTGFYPSAQLAREFGDVFFLNNAGNTFALP